MMASLKNKISLISVFEILIYISLFLYVFMIVFSNSTVFYKFSEIRRVIQIVIKLSLASIIGIGVLCILYYIINFRIKIFLVVVFILLCFQYFIVKRGGIILLYSYIMLGLTNKSNKIFKIIFISLLISVLCIVALSITKIIPNTIYPLRMHYNTNKFRNALGFFVANPVALFSFYLLLQYIFIRSNKFNIFESIFIFVLYSTLFFINETRFPYLLSLLALFLSIIFNYIKVSSNNSILKFIFKYIYILCPISLFILNLFYYLKLPYISNINKTLSGRLSLNLKGINNFGVHLLGNNIIYNQPQDGYNTIDSGYMCLLFEYGVIIFILLIVFLIFYCHILDNKYILLALSLIAIHSIFDNPLILILANPFYIFFFDSLREKYPLVKEYIRQ